MINLLTVEDRTGSSGKGKILPPVGFNSLKIRRSTLGNIELRHLSYINRSGRIAWKRIKGKLGSKGDMLVYSGDRTDGERCGIRFFDLSRYRARLCSNMALAVLEAMDSVPESLKVGLYDPYADCTDLCEHLLGFTRELVVVTRESRIYEAKAAELIWERGTPLVVSRYTSSLSRCGFIIAPCPIDRSFAPRTSSVILTSAEPSVSFGCRVYYNFGFKLPRELDRIKPEGIESESFAAALYSLEGMYSLGNIVPLVCTCGTDTQTYISLGRYLCDNFCS